MLGRWVGQRECAMCDFAGPETEFVGVVFDAAGLVTVPVDQTSHVVVCGGCKDAMARLHMTLARLAEAEAAHAS